MSMHAVASASQTSSRPPITLGSNTHLDPGAYARGTHAIALGENILVYPRAQLVAVHGPLAIGDKCIISEKCVIGGPVQSLPSTDAASKPAATPVVASTPTTPLLQEGEDDDERDPVKTTIGPNVYIQASSQIYAGATIKESVLIESHVKVLANVTVGAHAKICAGVIVERDVEEWTVIHGNGDFKRQRRKQSKNDNHQDDHSELMEILRLKAMDKEREGTVALLRTAARMTASAKTK